MDRQAVQVRPGAVGRSAVPQKKASWLRTILWMLSMLLLVNAAMAAIAYFLFFRNQ